MREGTSPAIRRVIAFMAANFAEPLSLAQLAALSKLSPPRFCAVFRQQVGMPPHQYLCHLRVVHAQSLLRQGMPPIEAAVETGFFDQSHLNRHFKRVCGLTPGQFVAAGRGEAGRLGAHDARV
jgi:transcriptional regulator GlxA family with amidase domain